MAAYRLSRRAALDLDEIYEYTILVFGLTQAQRYLNGLHDRFGILTQQPMLGRPAGQVAANLRRYEYGSHAVFYLPQGESILIVRVLHENMDASRHFMDDEAET